MNKLINFLGLGLIENVIINWMRVKNKSTVGTAPKTFLESINHTSSYN